MFISISCVHVFFCTIPSNGKKNNKINEMAPSSECDYN